MTVKTLVEAPIHAVVLYTKGQALGGAAKDDEVIVDVLLRDGMRAESIDLADIKCGPDGSLMRRDRISEASIAWDAPDVILMYHGALAPNNTAQILDALEAAGVVIVNGRSAWQMMTDKWSFYQLMMERGVPTIPTMLIEDHEQGMAALNEFGSPCVMKNPIGTEGDEVFIVSCEAELHAMVTSQLPSLGGRVIAQPFVESRIDDRIEARVLECIGAESLGMRSDIRVMTVAQPGLPVAVVACFMRVAANPEQRVNNVAKGAREVEIAFSDLHPDDQETLYRAAHAMPEAHVVGWDLIGQPGERVVMEANSGPGLPVMHDQAAIDRVLGPCARLMRELATR